MGWECILTFSKKGFVITALLFLLPFLSAASQLTPEGAWNARATSSMACYAHNEWKKSLDPHIPQNAEKILRSCFWCALTMKYEKKPKQEQLKLINDCIQLGKNLLKKRENDVKTGFWIALLEGSRLSLTMKGSNWDKVKSAPRFFYLRDLIKSAIEEIPEYYHYGPARMWGKFLLYVPESLLPVIGESYSRALELLKQACVKKPQYLMNCVYLADALRKVGKRRAAEKLYRKVINTDPGILPEEREENIVAIERAREKLSSMKKERR